MMSNLQSTEHGFAYSTPIFKIRLESTSAGFRLFMKECWNQSSYFPDLIIMIIFDLFEVTSWTYPQREKCLY